MAQASSLHFRKMSGLGNDFIVLDGRAQNITLTSSQIQALSDRDHGIGCDQLIILENTPHADIAMRIWNREGSEVESCGNASRCIADIVFDEQDRTTITLETKGGLLVARKVGPLSVEVDMGVPRFGWRDIPLSEEFRDTRYIELQMGPIGSPLLHSPSVVNVGNPHCIFWVKDLDIVDLAQAGPMLENHPLFPQRANISLALIENPDHVRIKVWERGAGLTQACGTAACAVAVAGGRLRRLNRLITASLPGGDLHIEWRQTDDHILMTGPISYDSEGTMERDQFGCLL